jgi:DNA-binding response OmpR family regulator
VNQKNLPTVPLAELSQRGLTPHVNPPADYVLVIDDEQLIADTLVQILRNAGYSARAEYDGESALESANLVPPQLVLADVRLPGMNGIEVGVAIADSVPDAKILLFSAQADTVNLDEIRRRGYDFPLLCKPVRPEELLKNIRKLREQQQTG